MASRCSQSSSSFQPPPIPSKPTLAEWFHAKTETSKVTEKKVQMEEDEGIAMDEISAEASSMSIPFIPQSKGRVLATVQTFSLPSSPAKAVVKANRSLDDLRAAILQMKATSVMDDSVELDVEPSYNHLPMEFRHADGYSYNEQSTELSSPKGMFSTFNSFSSHDGQRLKKPHGVSNVLHAPDSCVHYPVTSNAQKYKDLSQVKQPYLNLPPS